MWKKLNKNMDECPGGPQLHALFEELVNLAVHGSLILLTLTKWMPCGEVRRQDGCWTADIKGYPDFWPFLSRYWKEKFIWFYFFNSQAFHGEKAYKSFRISLRWSLTRLAEPRLSWSVNPWPDWSKEQRCSPALSQSPTSGFSLLHGEAGVLENILPTW